MAAHPDDAREPATARHESRLEARLTLTGVPGVMVRARRDLARILRVFAGKQTPELATALWQVAALFESGLPIEEEPQPPIRDPEQP